MQVPSEAGEGEGGDEPGEPQTGIQEENPLPVVTGEDAVYIFLDTNGEVPFGYNVGNEFYATHMVEITGQNGEILSSKLYQYHGQESLREWNWQFMENIDSASAGAELEAGLALDKDLLSELKVYFHIVSWDTEEDHAGPVGGELLPDVGTRTAPITGNTHSFGAAEDVKATTNDVYGLGVGDLDKDGNLDLVYSDGSNIMILENDGSPFGGWSENPRNIDNDNSESQTNTIYDLDLADLDLDGDLDIIAVQGASGDDTWIWENPWATADPDVFDEDWDSTDNTDPRDVYSPGNGDVLCVAVDDLDLDGDQDIIYGDAGNNMFILENPKNRATGAGDPFTTAWPATFNIGDGSDDIWDVTTADLDTDGDVDIISGEGGTTSDDVTIWENDMASIWSTSWTGYDIGTPGNDILCVAVGDLDNDGWPDIASGDAGDDILVWENDGTSIFSTTWTSTDIDGDDPAFDVNTIALADMDNDGDLDVLSGKETTTNALQSWQNSGSPFSGAWSGTNHDTSDDEVNVVAVGDLDNDGDTDVAYGQDAAGATSETQQLKNTLIHRNAPFGSQTTISTGADGAQSVFAADVDGDGDLDVLSASYNDDTITWYDNDGSQGFTARTIATDAVSAESVFAMDVDGDGDMDVLSASYDDDRVAWYENSGASPPTWTTHTISDVTVGAESVYAVDMDDDGDIDVLSASSGDSTVSWYENDGSQSFTRRTIDKGMGWPQSAYAADIDSDGDMDILFTLQDNDTIAWYENDGSESFTEREISSTAGYIQSVYATDVNGDGNIDVLAACDDTETSDTILWYENSGASPPVWTKRGISAAASDSRAVYATDMDMDGDIDVLSASDNDDKIAWYENKGGAPLTWEVHTISTAADRARSVFAADVDGDGDMDVLSASESDDKIAWYENKGGSAGYTVTDTAPASLRGSSPDDDVLRMVVAHNGISGDNHLEINRWDFLLEKNTGGWVNMEDVDAMNIFDNLYVYYSTDATWEAGDTLVATLSTFTLLNGVLSFPLPDNDASLEIPDTSSKTYFLVADMDNLNADTHISGSGITDIRFTFDPDAHSVNDDDTEDTSVSVADSSGTQTPVEVPEFENLAIPVVGVFALFVVVRRKRKI